MANSAYPRPMARPKEFCVHQALERAMEVFWEQGYEGASLSDLTARMGIQKASLYDTYGDKKHLYLAALKHYQDIGHAKVLELLETADSPLDGLKAVLMLALPCPSKPCAGCFCVHAMTESSAEDTDVKAQLAHHLDRTLATLRDAVEQAQAHGQIRASISPSEVADSLLALFYSVSLMGRSIPDRTRLESVIERGLAGFLA